MEPGGAWVGLILSLLALASLLRQQPLVHLRVIESQAQNPVVPLGTGG